MPTLRFDQARFSKTRITDEGYLETEAVVTRTGVFLYRNADGSTRRELRHPDEVFKQNSMASMRMIPITDGHPESKLVNADSAKSLQIGHVGENNKVDGRLIKAPLTITDSNSVAKVKSGKNQLSLGYTAEVIKEDGIYNGQKYDCKQTNIRYNHLAICSLARAGSEASIKLDEGDAIQLNDEDFETDSNYNNRERGKKDMFKINLDGIEYEAAAEVANAYKKAVARIDELSKESESKKGVLDEVTAEKERLKTKVDEFDKTLNEKVNTAVKARVTIVDAAKKILEKETKLDEMSNADVKKAVILAVSKDAKLDDVSADYINARFDAALEMHVARNDIADQRKTVGAKEGTSEGGKSTLLDAKDRYYKNLRGEK